MINQEKGQVLLVSVVIMVILALMALFMFDLQTTIRGKIKVETAEQAAALAAAEWQRKSLNLIGELNLVKASEAMLEGFSGGIADNDETQLAEKFKHIIVACRAMTEMQSRLGFVGPLIAFGAAQQAAKYNGVSIFDSYKKQDTTVYDEDEDEYELEGAEDGNKKPIYDEIRNYRRSLDRSYRYLNYEYCNYYAWREPYKAMLDDIRNRGMAVRGSGISYMESVDPPWMADDYVYETINFLHKHGVESIRSLYLKRWGILEMPDSFWEGKWWQVRVNFNGFKEQSEIYSLNINFSASSRSDAEMTWLYEFFAGSDLVMLESELLPAVTWCVFASSWSLNKSMINEKWYDGSFLREEIKDSFQYEGALAAASTYERISPLNNYQISVGVDVDPSYKQAQNYLKRGTEKRAIVSKRSTPRFRIGTDYAFGDSGGAVAKVVGNLDEDTSPHYSSLVLPVFETVTLVPSTMFNYTPFRSRYSALERFLIWVKDLETLDPPTVKVKDEDGNVSTVATSPPNGTENYHRAFIYLSDRDFRYSAWNPNYIPGSTPFEELFGEEYKYNSETNPNGAGWLQQAYVGPIASEYYRENECEKCYRFLNTEGKNNQFLLKSKENSQYYMTNEEFYRLWHYKGNQGGYSHGDNTGPSRL